MDVLPILCPPLQTMRLPLSQEQKLHLSNGFVQIPLADNRELYGIKFNDNEAAEEFYGKVRDHMGEQCV